MKDANEAALEAYLREQERPEPVERPDDDWKLDFETRRRRNEKRRERTMSEASCFDCKHADLNAGYVHECTHPQSRDNHDRHLSCDYMRENADKCGRNGRYFVAHDRPTRPISMFSKPSEPQLFGDPHG